MSVLTQLVSENPVLTKELRVRMRGARAYWILTGYLLFLSFILFIRYTFWWNEAQARGGMSMGSKIGQEFFTTIAAVQAFLVAFITPAVTSGAITIEREQRTMEMLEMTRISRGSIVAGKLISAVSFVALLLISSLPLTSICFFLGGVSPEQVAYVYLLLLAGSFVVGALGLAWSTVARTTSAAVLFTYSSLIVPLVVVALWQFMTFATSGPGNLRPENMFLALAVTGLFGISTGSIVPYLQTWDMRFYYGFTLPTWVAPVLSYTLIGIALSALAASRLETYPERKAPLLRWLVIAIFVQQSLFFFGARFSAYVGGGAGMAAALSHYPVLTTLVYPVLLLLLTIPIFATGEIRPGEARRFGAALRQGWTREGWHRGKLTSGLPYLWLLAGLVIVLYALSFVFIGQPRAALNGDLRVSTPVASPFRSSGSYYGQNYNPFRVPPTPGGRLTGHRGELLLISLVLIVTVFGQSVLGMLYSLMTRNRWSAMALSYATLFGIMILPVSAYSNYFNDPDHRGPSFLINLFYLNPLMSIAELTDTSGRFWSRLPLMFGNTPIWIVCVIGYLLLAAIAAALAAPFVTRTAAQPVMQYEDAGGRT